METPISLKSRVREIADNFFILSLAIEDMPFPDCDVKLWSVGECCSFHTYVSDKFFELRNQLTEVLDQLYEEKQLLLENPEWWQELAEDLDFELPTSALMYWQKKKIKTFFSSITEKNFGLARTTIDFLSKSPPEAVLMIAKISLPDKRYLLAKNIVGQLVSDHGDGLKEYLFLNRRGNYINVINSLFMYP